MEFMGRGMLRLLAGIEVPGMGLKGCDQPIQSGTDNSPIFLYRAGPTFLTANLIIFV
jgi:hypothetical protein